MTYRETEEAAALTIDQIRSMLDASAVATRSLLAQFKSLPANPETKLVNRTLEDLNRARASAAYTHSLIMDRLDPFGDQYLFQPPEPVQLTANGLIPALTGYCSYQDNTTVQQIAADTPTVLTNDRSVMTEAQAPPDIPSFYDGNRVWALQGDGMSLRVQLTVKPNDANNIATTGLLWFTTGTAQAGGRIFPVPFMLDGYNVNKVVSYSTSAYAGAAWATNGVRLIIEADGPLEVTSRSFLIGRWHKARP